MGKIRLIGIERRGIPEPEALANKMRNATSWIVRKRVVIHYDPKYDREARRVKELLEMAFRELGIPVERIELRVAPDHPDGSAIEVHSWLGKKKLQEPALHVGVGPFRGVDRVGHVTYETLASANIGGTLAVHPKLVRSQKAKELIIHEILHLFGLKHEHPISIMHPLRPEWDEYSKQYVRRLVKAILRMHGVD